MVERCVRMFVAVDDTFRDAGSGAIRRRVRHELLSETAANVLDTHRPGP